MRWQYHMYVGSPIANINNWLCSEDYFHLFVSLVLYVKCIFSSSGVIIRTFSGNKWYVLQEDILAWARRAGCCLMFLVLQRKVLFSYQTTLVTVIVALRNFLFNENLKRKIVDYNALEPCIKFISWATEYLQCQVAGLLAN